MKKVFKAIQAATHTQEQDFAAQYAARKKADPLQPSVALLCKLGSVIVHAQEFLSPSGHPADRAALETLFSDEELQDWIKNMGVYMPVKR
jgi:hypothetical protein